MNFNYTLNHNTVNACLVPMAHNSDSEFGRARAYYHRFNAKGSLYIGACAESRTYVSAVPN